VSVMAGGAETAGGGEMSAAETAGAAAGGTGADGGGRSDEGAEFRFRTDRNPTDAAAPSSDASIDVGFWCAVRVTDDWPSESRAPLVATVAYDAVTACPTDLY